MMNKHGLPEMDRMKKEPMMKMSSDPTDVMMGKVNPDRKKRKKRVFNKKKPLSNKEDY